MKLSETLLARGWPGALRTAVEIALVVALAVQSARLVWIVAEPVGPFGSQAASARPDADPELGVLAAFDPFVPKNASAAAVAAADVTGLRLHGVRALGTGGGTAIISAAGGRQLLYAVGEEIAPGVMLNAIAADHVVLKSGSRSTTLALSVGGPADAGANVIPPYLMTPRPLPSAPKTATAPVAVDPKQFLTEAGLRPRTENGRVTGYTLLPRGEGDMLSRAGLAAGDVVVALNGNRITPERYSELEQELVGSSQVQLTVERGSETRTITLQTGR